MDKAVKGNVGVERVVLSGLVQYGNEAYNDIVDIVNSNCFTIESNQAIFKCIAKVLETSNVVDATSIVGAAETLGLSAFLTKNKTDLEYIRSLFNFPIKLENIRPNAQQLAKLEIIRQGQAKILDAYRDLNDLDGTETASKILSIIESPGMELTVDLNSTNELSPELIGTNLVAELEHLAENQIEQIGIPTPYPHYNSLIGGGLTAGVHLIAARPKQGKSTLAINIGLFISGTLKIPVLYIDTEMLKSEQNKRITACASEIGVKLIQTGQFANDLTTKRKVFDAAAEIEKIPFYHKWVGGKEFEEIKSIIRRWIHTVVGFDENGITNPHVVIYDYFKLMDASVLGEMAEHQALGFQIGYLSDFAKKYQTPVLSFVQVNRDGMNKETSDIISQSDRLLWLCMSACLFKRKTDEEIASERQAGNRKLILLEGRNAEALSDGDYIAMNFDGSKSKITELGTYFSLKMKQAMGSGEDDMITVEDLQKEATLIEQNGKSKIPFDID